MRFTLLVSIFFLIVFEHLSAQETNLFKDSRDGHEYKTVVIGTQVWFAENLEYKSDSGCWAYDNKESNVSQYGRLYTFEMAQKVCPSGWHLPVKQEFEVLISYIGGNGINVYNQLLPSGKSGFNGLFGGFLTSRFEYQGKIGHFWSATEINAGSAWYLGITSFIPDAGISILDRVKNSNNKKWGFSIRCIKD